MPGLRICRKSVRQENGVDEENGVETGVQDVAVVQALGEVEQVVATLIARGGGSPGGALASGALVEEGALVYLDIVSKEFVDPKPRMGVRSEGVPM